MPKYKVTLARDVTRVEYRDVEVTAPDEETAEEEALAIVDAGEKMFWDGATISTISGDADETYVDRTELIK